MTRAGVGVTLLSIAALAAATGPPAASSPKQDALAVVLAFVAALGNADLEGVLGTLDERATVFMPMADVPSRLSGKAAIRSAFQPFLDDIRRTGKGPPFMVLTPHDTSIQYLGGDTAVVTFHMGPQLDEPITRPVTFSRRTFVLRRTRAGWRIVHLHASNVLIEAPGSKGRAAP